MSFESQLQSLADEIYACLSESDMAAKVVLAESCTGGRAAAALVSVAGISEYFCGSAVVYRADSKMKWLGVSESTIQQHSTESAEVTAKLATCVLDRTPEANVSAAVTGHLEKDSTRARSSPHLFVAIAVRNNDGARLAAEQGFELTGASRVDCQTEAAARLLGALLSVLRERSFVN